MAWRGRRWASANQRQKLLHLAGVPTDFWELSPRYTPEFISFQIEDKYKVTSVLEQIAFYTDVLLKGDIVGDEAGYLVVIGVSEGTDSPALAAAINVARAHILKERASVIDLGSNPPSNRWSKEDRTYWTNLNEGRLLVLHNLVPDIATNDRLQTARDYLIRYRELTRILVVADDDPYGFIVDSLRLQPDAALLVRGIQENTGLVFV